MKSNKLDALLRRVAEGNNSAFEELYEKTKRGAVRKVETRGICVFAYVLT